MSLRDVVVDARGRHVLAMVGKTFTVECRDAAMQPVWVNRELMFDKDVFLTPTPDGGVLVRQRGRHSAVVLDADGKQVGTVGGREPPAAQLPFLDLADADDLVADADGTFLVNVANHLQRFDHEGNGVHTWPQSGLRAMFHDRMTSLYLYRDESERTLVEWDREPAVYWRRRPHVVASHRVRGAIVGGVLYLVIGMENFSTDGNGLENAVGRFTRDGRCTWCARVYYVRPMRPAVDASGNVYVVTDRKDHARLHRIEANGQRDQVIGENWRGGGVVLRPANVTALPDGTVALWQGEDEWTLITATGTLIRMSAEMERRLEQERATRRQKLANDEELD